MNSESVRVEWPIVKIVRGSRRVTGDVLHQGRSRLKFAADAAFERWCDFRVDR